MAYVKLSKMPSPNPTQRIDFLRLDGGLNLWELDYRLANNQSPEMKNLWWQDGVLQCRDGQRFVHESDTAQAGFAMFQEPFWGHLFYHAGDKLYYCNPVENPVVPTELISGVPENRGTFLRYNDWLLYKNRGGFYKIIYDPEADVPFTAESVLAKVHTPTTIINASPINGSGDQYQPENRLSPLKRITYNAKEDVSLYKLPVVQDSVVEVKVDGVVLQSGVGYTEQTDSAGHKTGYIQFTSAPPVTTPATNNTVEIVYSKANPDALNAIMDCPYAIVYGGNRDLCVVVGGCPAQPNAFFWNGNDQYAMNLGYWPMSFYNFAGDTEDSITGFGKQYSNLIVFKSHSIGRANYSVEDVNDRQSISLNYTNINARIGCDLPWTIQLINNNLVFCNSQLGVHIVRDSSAAYENNIIGISRNVDGTDQRRGLLFDLRKTPIEQITSYDDDNRYWVCANGHVYAWDYVLSDYKDPSWFFFTNIHGVAYANHYGTSYHLDRLGNLTVFERMFSDYDGAIEKVYQFPVQNFGTYERLKDVLYTITAVRSDTDTEVKIVYQTDYEEREDLTEISNRIWHLVPRNLKDRYLTVPKFAHVALRKPGCRHVRHFTIRVENSKPAEDLAIMSTQVYYRLVGKER